MQCLQCVFYSLISQKGMCIGASIQSADLKKLYRAMTAPPGLKIPGSATVDTPLHIPNAFVVRVGNKIHIVNIAF